MKVRMVRLVQRQPVQWARCLALIVAALYITPSLAVSPDVAEYRQAVSAGAIKALQYNIIPRFSKTLPPDQMAVMRGIETRIIPNNLSLDLVQSSVEVNGLRLIEFGENFVLFDFVFCEDYLLAIHYNKIDNYIQFLSDTNTSAMRNRDRDAKHLPLENGPIFFDYLGEDRRDVEKVGEHLSGAAQEVFIANLAFIYAHELGHHLSGDLELTEINPDPAAAAQLLRQREAEADQFAMRLSLKAGYDVLGIVPTLMFMMEYERVLPNLSNVDHPSAACRFKTIAGVGMAAMEQDPDFPAYIRQTPGGLARWQKAKAMLRRLSDGLADQCKP